jgi:hypothetical protein
MGPLGGSLVTRSYPPVVSGVAVGVPLGLFAVRHERRFLPRAVWRRGVAAGALPLGGVALLALSLSHRP